MTPKFIFRSARSSRTNANQQTAPWWQVYIAFAVFMAALIIVNVVGLGTLEQQVADFGAVIVFFAFVHRWLQRHSNKKY